MRASHPEIAVLMMSAALDEEYPKLAIQLGAKAWLQKPLDLSLVEQQCRNLAGPDALA